MGTFAKRLGQLSARSFESESRNILRTGAANKVPGSLSLALDGTLKRGHDMKVFGLGTAASMANRGRYARFTASMHAVYSALEHELDITADQSPAIAQVWTRHGAVLRRAPALLADLGDVSSVSTERAAAAASPPTAQYVAGVREAAASDRALGGARLLGHLYCRYFADLFGGQMLAAPTRAALSLAPGTPRHYTFDLPAEGGRRAYIEEVYKSLNDAGSILSKESFDATIAEALRAFEYNVAVYSEEPYYLDAIRGGMNVCSGFLVQKLRSA
eukprot:TRINITY_DN14306_c1_g2_i1.p1 TRINITY_DN14306_c1_g2~~TRINITY_DN14306_c1_g2_i1.p1  ORF type:complete len:288 (-),score=57.94 TRINITY_DN14306_c1_g2_i1:143-961(-)